MFLLFWQEKGLVATRRRQDRPLTHPQPLQRRLQRLGGGTHAGSRATITDQTSAAELMLADPTLIKRPVLQVDDRLLVGFSEALYAAVFGSGTDYGPAAQ